MEGEMENNHMNNGPIIQNWTLKEMLLSGSYGESYNQNWRNHSNLSYSENHFEGTQARPPPPYPPHQQFYQLPPPQYYTPYPQPQPQYPYPQPQVQSNPNDYVPPHEEESEEAMQGMFSQMLQVMMQMKSTMDNFINHQQGEPKRETLPSPPLPNPNRANTSNGKDLCHYEQANAVTMLRSGREMNNKVEMPKEEENIEESVNPENPIDRIDPIYQYIDPIAIEVNPEGENRADQRVIPNLIQVAPFPQRLQKVAKESKNTVTMLRSGKVVDNRVEVPNEKFSDGVRKNCEEVENEVVNEEPKPEMENFASNIEQEPPVQVLGETSSELYVNPQVSTFAPQVAAICCENKLVEPCGYMCEESVEKEPEQVNLVGENAQEFHTHNRSNFLSEFVNPYINPLFEEVETMSNFPLECVNPYMNPLFEEIEPPTSCISLEKRWVKPYGELCEQIFEEREDESYKIESVMVKPIEKIVIREHVEEGFKERIPEIKRKFDKGQKVALINESFRNLYEGEKLIWMCSFAIMSISANKEVELRRSDDENASIFKVQDIHVKPLAEDGTLLGEPPYFDTGQ